MPTFTVTFEGLTEFQQLLRQLGQTATDAGNTGLMAVAEQFVSDAQSECPVDTGFLQSSIEVTGSSSNSVTVEASAPYAGFVDGGTIYQEPQPFFTGNVERLTGSGGMVDATDEIMQYWQDLCDRLAR